MFGPLIVSGSLGYTIAGKISTVNLRDTVFGTMDLATRLGEHGKLGLSYNYAQSCLIGGANSQDLTLSFGYEISKALKLQAYLLKGLNDDSPDHGAGINLNVSF